MKIYLAAPHAYPGMIAELLQGADGREFVKHGDNAGMQIFLAGTYSRQYVYKPLIENKSEYHPFILESFYYCNSSVEKLIPYFGDFLLDSGAFTFMQGKDANLDWNEYVERYADFINRNNIKKFFELDIDSVIGYEKVLQLRKKLERITCKNCIPVWHTSRGMQEFKKMCDEYDYVAIGGIVSKEIKPEQYKYLPVLINEAHKRNAKIHGLGFTYTRYLPIYHFDSVDSTSWTIGNRYGRIDWFDGNTMKRKEAPKGFCLADSRATALHNYNEWLKYQRYADRKL